MICIKENYRFFQACCQNNLNDLKKCIKNHTIKNIHPETLVKSIYKIIEHSNLEILLYIHNEVDFDLKTLTTFMKKSLFSKKYVMTKHIMEFIINKNESDSDKYYKDFTCFKSICKSNDLKNVDLLYRYYTTIGCNNIKLIKIMKEYNIDYKEIL